MMKSAKDATKKDDEQVMISCSACSSFFQNIGEFRQHRSSSIHDQNLKEHLISMRLQNQLLKHQMHQIAKKEPHMR